MQQRSNRFASSETIRFEHSLEPKLRIGYRTSTSLNMVSQLTIVVVQSEHNNYLNELFVVRAASDRYVRRVLDA